MKRSRVSTRQVNPFFLWADLARTTGEMLAASAYVIGHRTGRMALAGPQPSARDRREFSLMSEEKIEAAMASASAMSAHALRANLQHGTKWLGQMSAMTNAWMALASSRTGSQALTRHATLVRALASSPQSAAAMFDATARVMQQGLHPIHSRATANSRRLRKL